MENPIGHSPGESLAADAFYQAILNTGSVQENRTLNGGIGEGCGVVRTKLPSMRGVEAFLAAAEAGSMRSAAITMNLTVSAVSHRIQLLEEELGIRLLERGSRKLQLTPVGTRFRDDVEPCLSAFAAAAYRANASRDEHKITVATVPLLYSNWVMPRLNRFLAEYPHVRVELLSFESRAAEQADIVIRPVFGQRFRKNEQKLCDWRATPICHKDIVARHPIREPRDLLAMKLIDLDTPLRLWERWFAAAGISPNASNDQTVVDSQALMYDALLQGVGVGIATTFFSQPYLKHGLVRPIDLVCTVPGGLFISAETKAGSSAARAFRAWLVKEVSVAIDTEALPIARA